MMRVLMSSWEYPPHVVGGLGRHVAELLPALSALGVEVHLITPNLRGGPAEEQVAPHVWVYRVAAPDMTHDGNDFVTFAQTSNSSLEQQAKTLLERWSFDLVHVHDWLVAYSGVAVKYAARLPLIATVHATERGRGQGQLASEQARAINGTEWWLTYEAWRVITVSNFMAGQINGFFGVPGDKIDVIYNGVQLPSRSFPEAQARRAFRQHFAADDEQVVLYVGRIVHEKGLQVLINAVPAILAQCRSARFVIAGTGPYLDQLRHQAWMLGVSDVFTFTGFIADEERDQLYQVADVAVFPSLYEPFGIVALEAMAYGCPVVVSATGGFQEVVKLHETGITAHAGDPGSLAWAITHTLLHPEWAAQRAANALREVQSRYTWEHVAQQTAAVYEQVRTSRRLTGWS